MAKNTGIGSRRAQPTLGVFREARKAGGRFGQRPTWWERLRAVFAAHPGGETND